MSYPRWTRKFEVKPGAWVFVPSDQAISVGKSIKSGIEKHWQPPLNYYHLLPGGHLKALRLHLNNTVFIHLDIQNFFDSINKSRVTRNLKKYFGYAKAREMAVESTVKINKDGSQVFVLPFGFVQSALLASLCLYHSKLGQYIEQIRKTTNYVKISVYMDDIIISTKNVLLSEKILERIKIVADKSNFPLNEKKEEGPAIKITAFNINLTNKETEIENNRLFKFVLAYRNAGNEYQEAGIENYIRAVNKNQANHFITNLV